MDFATTPSKPRMALFRWNKASIPPFISSQLNAQLRALNHFFEVLLIDYDCDYGRVCDHLNPAISVFESGVYSSGRRIVNTGARPDIPKLGFLHADAYDLARAVFLSDMEQWGVEEFFTTSVAMAEYTPEIRDRLFVWPNAVDPQVFRDYGLRKTIPILFTGSQERHYPWRNAVTHALTPYFITMTMPHYGWGRGTSRTVFGPEYAKLLNSSFFVPSCGSMARDIVRKLLEIPASMACLVTEPTPHLQAFGFEDMVNCVLADAQNIVDKLDSLWKDQERLRLITQAGHDLVHSKHTEANRNQVLQWLELKSAQSSGHTIQQESPCGPLYLAPDKSRPPVKAGPGLDRTYIAEGWRLLRRNIPEQAEREFLKCLNYYFIPEAITGLVFASLAKGDASTALTWANRAIAESLKERGAADPDPVIWACRIRALLCLGESDAAIAAARRFSQIKNIELDRVRAAVAALFPAARDLSVRVDGKIRPSITPVPELDSNSWKSELAWMLAQCGQAGHAAVLHGGSALTGQAKQKAPSVPALISRRVNRTIRLRLTSGRVLRIRIALSPYKQRIIGDNWSRLVGSQLRREELTRAIAVGNVRRKDARSLFNAVRQSAWLPQVCQAASCAEATARGLFSKGEQDRIAVYLAPIAGEPETPGKQEMAGLRASSLVVLDGTDLPEGFAVLEDLLDTGIFRIIAQEAAKGRVILRRLREISDQRPQASATLSGRTRGHPFAAEHVS